MIILVAILICILCLYTVGGTRIFELGAARGKAESIGRGAKNIVVIGLSTEEN